MYRIQLPSGEEAVYRTVEELAVGIHNGLVDDTALVFHHRTGAWLPIETHPHFARARTLALAPPEPEAKASLVPGPVRPGGGGLPANPPPPASPSESHPAAVPPAEPARGNSESFVESLRRADAWEHAVEAGTSAPNRSPAPAPATAAPGVRLPGTPGRRGPWLLVAVASALASVAGWLTLAPEPSRPLATATIEAGMTAPATSAPPHSGGAPAAADSPATVSHRSRLPEHSGGAAGRPETYRASYHEARTRLVDEFDSIDFGRPFAASRIATLDSLRVARRRVAAARNVIAVYRGEEVRIDQRFGHPAPSLKESFSSARMADSLLLVIDSIYGLMEANSGRYRVRQGGVSFTDSLATTLYLRLAAWLESRLGALRRDNGALSVTVSPIVAAAGRPPRLRVNR